MNHCPIVQLTKFPALCSHYLLFRSSQLSWTRLPSDRNVAEAIFTGIRCSVYRAAHRSIRRSCGVHYVDLVGEVKFVGLIDNSASVLS